MGVSRRSYAMKRGVSQTAVHKAITTINSARAASEWFAQTDPANQRGLNRRQMGA